MRLTGLLKPKAVSEPMPVAIEVDGVSVAVSVRQNARAQRLVMRVDARQRQLTITVPPGVDARFVRDFLSARAGWVAQRLDQLMPLGKAGLPDQIALRGLPCRLVATFKARGTVHLEEGALFLPGLDAEAARRRLIAYLKQEARADLEQAVARHSAMLGVKAAAIRLKDTGSRWGSCSSARVLSFSWRIVMAPPEILSYLAAHEVAHLRHMNHSAAFWQTVAALDGAYRRHDRWLKDNGQSLMGAGI